MQDLPHSFSALTAEIESRLDSFEAEHRQGNAPQIENWLDGLTPEERERCLFELLGIELGWFAKSGQKPELAKYLQQFSDDESIIRVAFGHFLGDAPNAQDDTRSFAAPDQSTQTFEHARDSRLDSFARDKIGAYLILNTIAVHGQGAVYRANHPHLNRQVVIKVSKDQVDPVHQENLQAEGRTLASLSHPNLAQIYDLQFEDGRPYLVMEYIEGRNLAEQLKEQPLAPNAAAELIATLARAMHHAHSLGVIHYDLKPANVVIRASDRVPKVIDFGLARAKTAYIEKDGISSYGGTIGYMAPEQAQEFLSPATGGRSRCDERVDIFALGAILYETLTGKRLYSFQDNRQGLDLAAECKFDRGALADAPEKLRSACLKALADKPAERWSSAAEFADALDAATESLGDSNTSASSKSLVVTGIVAMALFTGLMVLLANPGSWFASNENLSQIPGEDTNPDQSSVAPSPAAGVLEDAQLASDNLFTAEQFRHFSNDGQFAQERGELFEIGSVSENDDLRVDAILSTSSYLYLFAINPDGGIQLCYPEGIDQEAWDFIQMEPTRELRYPEDSASGFAFTDGTGQQAFVLVQSAEPLPAFGEWLSSLGEIQGALDGTDKSWVWQDNELSPFIFDRAGKTRGGPRKLSGVGGFDALMTRLQASLPNAEVSGITFPVVPKE